MFIFSSLSFLLYTKQEKTYIVVELSIKFDFPVSTNQAEYEVLIPRHQLAAEVGATQLTISNDSQVVTL